MIAGCGTTDAAGTKKEHETMPSGRYRKPSDEELRKKLTPDQYRVTQEEGTEPPFRNEFWDNHAEGLYVDVATGEPLFSSRDKFESGTGWPSFSKPVEDGAVKSHTDRSLGMERTEVTSRVGESHLGHVFDDGPAPAGLRYCINSASLRFIPADRLAAEGYGEYAAQFGRKDATANPDKLESVVLAGGCFWGMEDIIRKIPGVVSTEVGYAGGTTPKPSYKEVSSGKTGHAESVKVVYDPSKLSFEKLLTDWYFKMHDPTTKNQQGNDVGSQYRSAIFYTTEDQRRVAEEVKARVEKSGKWKRPIVTEIAPAGPFTSAEDYHQDYLQKNPGGYTCHWMRDLVL